MAEARALSLHQPWASLVAVGSKSIIDRAESTQYRGRLLIHADDGEAPFDPAICRALFTDEPGEWKLPTDPPLPRNAIVASCQLVDCVPIGPPFDREGIGDPYDCVVDTRLLPEIEADRLWLYLGLNPHDVSDQRPFGNFTPGRYAWILDDVKPTTEPIPCRGRQGLWTPPPEVLERIA